MSIQRSVVKKINASLSILSEVCSGDFTVQSIAHKAADIAPTLLLYLVKPQMNSLSETKSFYKKCYKQ